MVLYVVLFVVALVVSLCLTPAVRAAARWAGVLDVPDGRRKLHSTPVPKLGGVAVFVSFYACMWLVATQIDTPSASAAFELASAMFLPSLLILALGIADDKWSISPWGKIGVQIAAGLLVYYQLGIRVDTLAMPFTSDHSMLGLLSLPATLFWIVLITNAFNVVDGMDGLATGVAFIALACMFMVALQMQQPAIAFAAASLAGAVLGFLRYNFNPASIFLGDSGSLFLGFQLAVLSIVGSQKSSTAVAVAAPLFVLALPLIETATSAVRRFVTGRSILRPDSGHIHHQLIRLGFTPRRAAGILYLVSGTFGLTSLFLVQSGAPNVGMIAVLFFLVTWLAIQRLGYTEFAEINGALRRFVSQRRIIQNGIVCRRLADDLAEAPSIGEAWSVLTGAARKLGFAYVELKLLPWAANTDRTRQMRYTQRLAPETASSGPHETTFAVSLTGARGALGEVVLSRSAAAAPLHSELPLLIDGVARGLPRVIERGTIRVVSSPHRVAPVGTGLASGMRDTNAAERRAESTMTCTACGSSDLYRSRSRSGFERLRKRFTERRLHECGSCGWRGWREPEAHATVEAAVSMTPSAPDLEALDLAIQNITAVQRQGS